MKIEVLGAYGGESTECRMTCLLINDGIALDAGSLTQSLSLERQSEVHSIILSHSHLDHTNSLPFFIENMAAKGWTLRHLIEEVDGKKTLEFTKGEEAATIVLSREFDPSRASFLCHLKAHYRPLGPEETPFDGEGLHLQMQEDPCDYAEGNVFAGGAPVKT